MKKTVVAIFNNMDEAEAAADDLFDNGFLKENIDVSPGEKYLEDEEGESSITRFFKNLFGNNDEKTERYSRVARKGFVVSVHTQSQEEALEACEILDDNGAIDVNDHYRKHYPATDEELTELDTDEEEANHNTPVPGRDRTTGDAAEMIPVIEEDLKVHKKEVPTGGVRIRSRIVEKPVEENLRLREEHIHVERRKVNREPTEEELENFKNETTGFTEHGLQKDVDHTNQVIHDKVRRSDVDVEGAGRENDEP